jgi:hypothetical protein
MHDVMGRGVTAGERAATIEDVTKVSVATEEGTRLSEL